MSSARNEKSLTVALYYLNLYFALQHLEGPTENGGHWLSDVFIYSKTKALTVSLDTAEWQRRISEVCRKKGKDKYRKEQNLEKQEHLITCTLGKDSHDTGSLKE